jgi:beta-lactamase class A
MMRYCIILFLLLFIAISRAEESPNLENYPVCDFAQDAEEGLRFGAVLYDFETGLGCVSRLNETFNAASVPKVFIAAAYYDFLARGAISPTTRIQFTRNYWMAGQTDCLTESRIGETFSYQELIEMMINCSDNASTWLMMDSLGWGRINDYVRSLGIDGIGEIIPYSEVDRLKLSFWMKDGRLCLLLLHHAFIGAALPKGFPNIFR